MEIVAVFLSSFLVGLSGALMPGPVLTVTIAHAMKRGHAAGPLVSLGHGIIEGALVIALALGLSQLFQLPAVAGGIGVAGGLCLLYMGTSMIRAPAAAISLDGQAAGGAVGPVAAGILTSVSNPYWVLWWATIGATYLLLSLRYGPVGIAAFYVGHFMADLGWLSAVGSAVAAGRKVLGPRAYKVILAFCGGFLLILGVYFLVSGIGSLAHL